MWDGLSQLEARGGGGLAIYRVGIDVGGTFTDAVCLPAGQAPETAKVLTTYPDPAVGVIQVLGEFARRRGLEPATFCAELETIVHGTTVTTNALLTGGLARTGLLATSGFRDSLEMRKGYREAMYDNRYEAPAPVVPRELRVGVVERVAADGKVVTPIDEGGLDAAIEAFAAAEVEAVAISFMHSYANPSHERQVLEQVRAKLGDGVYVTASTDVLARIGYYERTSTTCVNAGAGPLFGRYLSSLARRLDATGFGGLLLIMQSGGGMASVERAAELACNSLLSGPAGGVVAAQRHAAVHGFRHCLSMDMGGTSFDICAIEDGEPLTTTEAGVGAHRVATPMVDIRTIGAGGGSIAWVDSGGLLRVGPQSAGSTPGPASYGRGGELPTVTDANLVLGYLDPGDFWGGRLELDRERAVGAIRTHVAEPLGLGVEEAALGIFRVVSVNMTAAARQVTVERGNDPRDYVLIVGGGAGPVHASVLLEELGAAGVLIPAMSAVMSAGGMLMADVKDTQVRTVVVPLAEATGDRFADLRAEMSATAGRQVGREGELELHWSVELRYGGQLFEIAVPVEEAEFAGSMEEVAARFHDRHGALHGFSVPDAEVQLINVRLDAVRRRDWLRPSAPDLDREEIAVAATARRPAWFDGNGGEVEVDAFTADELGLGAAVQGPALVSLPNSAVVVNDGMRLVREAGGDFSLSAI